MGAVLQHISDEELYSLYKEGKGDIYLEALWNRYHHLVFASAFKYLKNKSGAEDIKQRVFQKLIELPQEYRIERFVSWLGIVTRNLAIEEQRKIKRSMEKTWFSVAETDDDELGEKEQNLSRLENRVSLLNKAQQLCIRLFYLEGKSYKEVSEISGFSANEVKTHIQNGKRNLKSLFLGK